MIRICVAVLVAAAFRTSAEPQAEGYPSAFKDNKNENPPQYKTPLADLRRLTPNPSNIHETQRSSNIKYGRKLPKSKLPLPKTISQQYGASADQRTRSSDNPRYDDKLIRKNVSRRNQTVSPENSHTKKAKSDYEAPAESVSLERSPDDGTLRSNYQMPKDIDQLYTSPKTIINSEKDEKLQIATSYGEIDHIKSSTSSLATTFRRPKHIDSSYSAPDIKLQKQVQHSHDTPSNRKNDELPNSTYGTTKALDTKYGVPNHLNRNFDQPRLLEDSYDAMHSIDLTYGAVRNTGSSHGILENSSEHVPPYPNDGGYSISDTYYGSPNTQRSLSSRYTDTDGSNNMYNVQILNKNNDVNIDQNFKGLGDTFEEHASIASKHTAYLNDQQFEDSKAYIFKERSVDNYPDEASHQRHFNDYDQSDHPNNENDFGASFNSVPSESYENPRKLSDYGVSRMEHSRLQSSFPEALAAKSSPGITGVTQAIIRNSPPAIQPTSRYQVKPITRPYFQKHKGKMSTSYGQKKIPPHNKQSYSNHRTTGESRKFSETSHGHYGEEETSDDYSLGRDANADENVPAVYQFEYAVSDYGSDSQFGHREARQYARAKGSYHVLLPDGRKQIVEYEADERGFNPTITYEEAPSNSGYELGPNARNGYDENSQNFGTYNNEERGSYDVINARDSGYRKEEENGFKFERENNDDYGSVGPYEQESTTDNYGSASAIDVTESKDGDFGSKFQARSKKIHTGENDRRYS